MTPLAEAVRRHVFGGPKLHADDTVMPVLAPGRGKTQEGRLWVYGSDDRRSGSERPPAVWFDYSPDRRHEHAALHLAHYRGILQADAWAGFEGLDGERIVFVPCWAHVKRKFFDIESATHSPLAQDLLARIAALYAIEDQIVGRPPPKRAAVRRARAGPLLLELRNALIRGLMKERKRSELAKAIRYALVRFGALTRYVHDGRLEMG